MRLTDFLSIMAPNIKLAPLDARIAVWFAEGQRMESCTPGNYVLLKVQQHSVCKADTQQQLPYKGVTATKSSFNVGLAQLTWSTHASAKSRPTRSKIECAAPVRLLSFQFGSCWLLL